MGGFFIMDVNSRLCILVYKKLNKPKLWITEFNYNINTYVIYLIE